ncbi:MAG TPA: CBS domain-containing protein [Phycisphaerae bacterium]|jgi:CBS domain-containing protein|nr:CBS domain-containing protein [Phycisphaerae bacterium]HOB73293.1 CBS domain-containing protein [Phycisphaerae bacterium]HOJ55725.1 CBS domain-containing protein [Phycisphaerae bacterium]HOL26112.1 CBS domain-containing protein [Phycisphaerae bacterium]HPP22028.1 CBS domain-containing protein [Phycisphaerae bacterium]
MRVKDIMTSEVACCTPDTGLQQVAKMMVDCNCGAIPVIADEQSRRLVGIVTDRDIVCRTIAQGRDPMSLSAQDCMSRDDIACVTPESDLNECCRVMEEHQIRRVPVVDENNCLRGIVAQADVARHASREGAAEMVKEVSQPR